MKKTLVCIFFAGFVVVGGLTFFIRNPVISGRKDTPVFYANVCCITKYISSTKTESRVLYLTPGSNVAVMRYRSDGQWLDSLENRITLAYPYTGSSVLKIWLISDIHATYNKESEFNFLDAIHDIDSVENIDYVFAAGDLISGATVERFDIYRSLKATSKVSLFKWYELAGDHELTINSRETGSPDNFKNRLSYRSLNYTVALDNFLFIFLGDEGLSVAGELSPSQLAWLAYQLSFNHDKNIVILSHYSIYNTTLGSATPTAYHTPVISIEQLIDYYPVNMWLHGNTHLDAGPGVAVFKPRGFWKSLLESFVPPIDSFLPPYFFDW